jgi:ABC-type transport system involved in cytochrome c biogenesis permease subunit
MSIEDLENMGVLLPEDQWGKHAVATTVNKPLLIAIGVITMISVVLMYWGNGNFSTWLGVALFLTMLSGFTLLSISAVEKQRRGQTGGKSG